MYVHSNFLGLKPIINHSNYIFSADVMPFRIEFSTKKWYQTTTVAVAWPSSRFRQCHTRLHSNGFIISFTKDQIRFISVAFHFAPTSFVSIWFNSKLKNQFLRMQTPRIYFNQHNSRENLICDSAEMRDMPSLVLSLSASLALSISPYYINDAFNMRTIRT